MRELPLMGVRCPLPMVVVGCPIAMTYDIATPIKMGMTMAMTWVDGFSYIVP